MAKNEVRNFKKEIRRKKKTTTYRRITVCYTLYQLLCIHQLTWPSEQPCEGFITQTTPSALNALSKASSCPFIELCWCLRQESNIRCQSCLSIPWRGGWVRERKSGHSEEGKYLSPLVWDNWRWWEKLPVAGGALAAICLSLTHSLLPGARQIQQHMQNSCGGVSLAHFQDFCEKPKSCWLEQKR